MSNHLDLQKQIDKIDEFHQDGFERVKMWYDTPEPDRQDKTGLEKPPHEYLLDRATGFVLWGIAIRESIRGTMDDDPGVTEIHDVFLAIGTEILLKACILEMDHSFYFKNSSAGHSMGYEKAQNRVLDLLSQELDDKQKKRLKLVLDLLKLKRDEAVHFGFHRRGYHGHPKEMYRVLAYLIKRFGSSHPDVINPLETLIEEHQRRHSGMDYRQVEFPLFDEVGPE